MRPASSRASTSRPSRRTVTRWHSAKTSSSRCEMNRTATPDSRSVAATPNRRSTSTADSAAVGSSITITRASSESAFAISTSCCSAIESPRAIRSGSSRHAEALEDRVRLRAHGAAIDAPARKERLPPDEDVLDHGQVGEQRRLLVDDCDPRLDGGSRAAQRDLDAVDEQPPAVRGVDAGEDLDQRRLASAVLAHERVRLAGVEVDRDVLEGMDRAERLRRVLERQDRGRGPGRFSRVAELSCHEASPDPERGQKA